MVSAQRDHGPASRHQLGEPVLDLFQRDGDIEGVAVDIAGVNHLKGTERGASRAGLYGFSSLDASWMTEGPKRTPGR